MTRFIYVPDIFALKSDVSFSMDKERRVSFTNDTAIHSVRARARARYVCIYEDKI